MNTSPSPSRGANVPPDVIVIGGGQAGLAMAWHLRRQGASFLVLDAAGEIGHVWRSRWDSLVQFTAARYDSLPGFDFPAPADAYPTKDEVADYLRAYAEAFDLPVRLNTRVTRLSRNGAGFEIDAAGRTFHARQVVVATGPVPDTGHPGCRRPAGSDRHPGAQFALPKSR